MQMFFIKLKIAEGENGRTIAWAGTKQQLISFDLDLFPLSAMGTSSLLKLV